MFEIRESIKRWQERLLDLTKRNRLLYFKPGRTCVRLTLPVADGGDGTATKSECDRIFDLVGSRKGLVFDYADNANYNGTSSVCVQFDVCWDGDGYCDGRIAYKRPNGSLTPDRDPVGFTMN